MKKKKIFQRKLAIHKYIQFLLLNVLLVVSSFFGEAVNIIGNVMGKNR